MTSLRLRLLLPIGVGWALLLLAGGWLAHRGVAETLERGVDATLRERARWWADRLVLRVEPERRFELEALGSRALGDLAHDHADPTVRQALLQAARRPRPPRRGAGRPGPRRRGGDLLRDPGR